MSPERLLDGRELVSLPCGHPTPDNGELEIACPTCHKVFRRIGLRLEAPERWRLPATPGTRRILVG